VASGEVGKKLGMYLRTIARHNKGGSTVRYLQLAHNEWDAQRKCAVAKVVHSFGREDELDRAALARLVRSISRLLEPAEALAATAPRELRFLGSKPLGGALVLDGLWRRLGIDEHHPGFDGDRVVWQSECRWGLGRSPRSRRP
jgi:hypothetical protein